MPTAKTKNAVYAVILPSAGAGFAKALSITLFTSGENHIMRRPAIAASARPFFVAEASAACPAALCLTLNAIALQAMETTISASPASMNESDLPAGLNR